MGRRRIDITGQRFGKLIVVELVKNHKYKGVYWLCKCDCGNNHIVLSSHLRRGLIKSCGDCDDLTGKQIGDWSVLKRSGNKRNQTYLYLCRCKCGLENEIASTSLRSGNTKSCPSCAKKGDRNPMFGKVSYQRKYETHRDYILTKWKRHSIKRMIQKYNLDLTQDEKQRVIDIYTRAKELGIDYQVDHIIPLSRGGLHHPDNLQIVLKSYNLQKNNKLESEFRKPLPFEVWGI